MKLTELTDATLTAYIEGSALPTVLTFHAPWSKPSRTMRGVMEEVATEYKDIIRFAVVDTDGAARAVTNYGVLSLPTYLIFKNGKLIDRFIGLLTKEKFIERIERDLQSL